MSLTRQQIVKLTIVELDPEYKQMEEGRLIESKPATILYYAAAALGLIQKKSPLLKDLTKQDDSQLTNLVKYVDERKDIPEGKFKIIFRILSQCLDEKKSLADITKSIDETIINNKSIKFEDNLKRPFTHLLQLLTYHEEIINLKASAAAKSLAQEAQLKAIEIKHAKALANEHLLQISLKEQLDKKAQEQQETQTTLTTTEKTLDETRKELNEKEMQLGKNQPKICSLRKQVETLCKEREERENHINKLTQQISDNDLEIANLNDTIANVTSQKSELGKRNQQLEHEIKQAQTKYNDEKSLLAQHIQSLDGKMVSLKLTINSLRGEKTNLEEKISTITKNNNIEIDKHIKKCDDLTKKLKAAQATNNEQLIIIQTQLNKIAEQNDRYDALSLAYFDLKGSGQPKTPLNPTDPSQSLNTGIRSRSTFLAPKSAIIKPAAPQAAGFKYNK